MSSVSRTEIRTQARAILALGACVAIGAGWIHGLALWASHAWLGSFTWVSRDYAWMSPLAHGVVLLPGAVVLAAMALVVPRGAWWPIAVACCFTVGAFSLLLPVSELSRVAALLLSAGVGAVALRLASRTPAAGQRVTMRAAPVMMVLVVGAWLALPAWRRMTDRRAVAALPTARPGSPHILLIVLDAMRARDVGFVTPAAGTTPRLDRWAAEGTVFTQAYSVGPWTLPSHASMMTGRYASELAADWTVPSSAADPALPVLLQSQGYATGAFVANLHYTAWDSGITRGFSWVDDYQADAAQWIRSAPLTQTNLVDTLLRGPLVAALPAVLRPDLSIVRQHRYQSRLGGEVVDAYLAWRRQTAARPTFALLNLMDPHLKTRAPQATRRRYPHDARGLEDYREAMRYLDAELDRLLTTLAADGTLDSTAVIITADHGELLGEHGLHGHAQSLYRDVVHVPLFVRYPGHVPSARVARPVSLRDLAATILDLAGATDTLPGVPLRRAWSDSLASTSPVFATARQQPSPLGEYPTAFGDLSGTFDEGWSYIINHGTGKEELFRVAAGGDESANLADDPAHAARLAVMREATELYRRRYVRSGR